MRKLLYRIETYFFGPEIEFKYQDGTKVPDRLIYV